MASSIHYALPFDILSLTQPSVTQGEEVCVTSPIIFGLAGVLKPCNWPSLKGIVSTTPTGSEFRSTRDLETVNSGVNREVFEIFPHFQVFQQLNFNT